MPSQKQSKRRRHDTVPPPPRGRGPVRVPVPPQAPGSGRRASPRVLLAVGGGIVAVVVAVVLAVSLSGGSSSSPNVPAVGTLTGALPGAAEVNRLFKGIPQDGNELGSPSAPVTMVEYIDIQCPVCREFESSVLPTIVSSYVRPGKVRIEQRVLAFIGPDSVTGRNAVLAAGQQGKQFDLAELLYFNQGAENGGWLDQTMVDKAAASIPGLHVPLLLSTAKSSTVKAKAATADTQAKTDTVTGTPTILVGRTGTTPQVVNLTSATDVQPVKAAIQAALAG